MTIDVVNEAILPASPDRVWTELIAELNGGARWWVPHNTYRTEESTGFEPGTVTHVTVHTRGVGRRGPKLEFVARVSEVNPDRELRSDYIGGVFRGGAVFRLIPLADGYKTKLVMHFRAEPQGFAKVLNRLADMGAKHREATQSAFQNLEKLLNLSGASS